MITTCPYCLKVFDFGVTAPEDRICARCAAIKPSNCSLSALNEFRRNEDWLVSDFVRVNPDRQGADRRSIKRYLLEFGDRVEAGPTCLFNAGTVQSPEWMIYGLAEDGRVRCLGHAKRSK